MDDSENDSETVIEIVMVRCRECDRVVTEDENEETREIRECRGCGRTVCRECGEEHALYDGADVDDDRGGDE